MNKWTPEGQRKLEILMNNFVKEATLIVGDEKEVILILAKSFAVESLRISLKEVLNSKEEEIFKQTPGCDCEYCKPKKEAIN